MTSDPLAYHYAQAARTDVRARYREDSACAGRPLLMDPPTGHTPASERAAIAVCRSCPILARCQAQVLALPEELDPGGVIGGLSERRRKQRRRRARWEARNTTAPPGQKECRTCGEPKDPTDFYSATGTADDLDTRCKDCCRKIAREHRAARKNRERS